jgi:hypothetical protein
MNVCKQKFSDTQYFNLLLPLIYTANWSEQAAVLCQGLNVHTNNFLHSPATSSIQDLFTILGTLFSNTSISARNIKLPVCIRGQKVKFSLCVLGKINTENS